MTSNANSIPQLNGLVLAGGKSMRMGKDKSIMHWHNKEQRYYMADLLQSLCSEVFISCRADQQQDIDPTYPALPDAYTGMGPFGAILSAFTKNANVAWLVVACDLPLLDTDTLRYLIEHRDATAIATTFESPFDNLPEPLITIWEPSSYPLMQAFMSEGISCPRKTLIRNKERVNMLKPPRPDALLNANTPEDAAKVRELLAQHHG